MSIIISISVKKFLRWLSTNEPKIKISFKLGSNSLSLNVNLAALRLRRPITSFFKGMLLLNSNPLLLWRPLRRAMRCCWRKARLISLLPSQAVLFYGLQLFCFPVRSLSLTTYTHSSWKLFEGLEQLWKRSPHLLLPSPVLLLLLCPLFIVSRLHIIYLCSPPCLFFPLFEGAVRGHPLFSPSWVC